MKILLMAVLLSLTFTAHADELKDLRAEVKELQTAVVDLHRHSAPPPDKKYIKLGALITYFGNRH